MRMTCLWENLSPTRPIAYGNGDFGTMKEVPFPAMNIAKYGVWNDGNLWYGDVVSRPDHMVKPGNEYYKARFFDKRDEVKATYEEQIEKLLQEYQKIGKQTYQLLWQQAYSLLQMHELTDESAFLAYFAQQIRDNIKPADKFAESFKYDWTIERI